MILAVPNSVLPSRKRRMIALGFLGTFATLVAAAMYLNVSPENIVSQFHFVVELAQDMLPPNLKLLWQQAGLIEALAETLSMAFLGTVAGGLSALVLALLAAVNTSPGGFVRTIVRAALALERALPNFIVMLVLLIAVGIGPFAGMLALTIGTIGMFGKLFADTIEQADKSVTESVQSVGSTRLQLIRYAILPQLAPSFIANLFYAFDFNLRAAIPLGFFGGGGIGLQLEFAERLLRYKDMLAYTLIIVILITGMERISDWVRRRLIT